MITKAPDLFWKQNHVTSQQPRGLCWWSVENHSLFLVPTRGTHQQLPAFKLPAGTEHSKVCKLWLSFAGLTAKRFTSVDAHWKGRKRGKKKLTWRLSDGSWHRCRHGATRPLRTARSGARLPATVFTMSAEGFYVVTEPRYKTTAAKNIRNETFFRQS